MSRLLALSVSNMMLLLTASGFIVALTFAGPQIWGLFEENRKFAIDNKLTSLASAVSDLTHEMQKERGASAGYISSQGKSFADSLPLQRVASDGAINRFMEKADTVENLTTQETPLIVQLAEVRKRIEKLDALRQNVDDLKISTLAAVNEITALNKAAISILPNLGKEISYATAARAVQRHAILMTAKDISGLERATGATGFALASAQNGVVPPDVLTRFNVLIQKQTVLFQLYQEIASDELSAALSTFNQAPVSTAVASLRETAKSADAAAILSVSAEDWFTAATKKIDLIKELEDRGVAELVDAAAEALALSDRRIFEMLSLLAVLLVVVGISTFFLARSVIKAISVTSERVTNMADGDIESDIPKVLPSDLRRITDALKIFQNGELERRNLREKQTQLELSSVKGIERMKKEIAAGDFTTRLRLRDLNGASKILGEGINDIMVVVEQVAEQQSLRDRKALDDQISTTKAGEQAVEELNKVVLACVQGNFSLRLNTEDKEGIFADLCRGVNRIGEVTENGLTDLAEVLDAVAGGNLTKRMSEEYEGMFLEISRKINTTSLELSRIVSQISNGADSVQMSSTELSETADDLAQRTERTAASLEVTSSSVKALTQAIKSNAQGAKGVGLSAKATQKETEDTMSAVGDMVVAIEGIAASSEEISKITGVIEDIAFQTNLLALNAGVEAARAGESGRGFSVVASEVRILAQRAADAAKDISELIAKSQDQVDAGVKIVGRSRSALESIQSSISGMTKEVVQLVDTAAEQSVGITEINSTVMQMEQETQRNAAMFEETNAVAQTMRQEAGNLSVAISHFSIGAREDPHGADALANSKDMKLAS